MVTGSIHLGPGGTGLKCQLVYHRCTVSGSAQRERDHDPDRTGPSRQGAAVTAGTSTRVSMTHPYRKEKAGSPCPLWSGSSRLERLPWQFSMSSADTITVTLTATPQSYPSPGGCTGHSCTRTFVWRNAHRALRECRSAADKQGDPGDGQRRGRFHNLWIGKGGDNQQVSSQYIYTFTAQGRPVNMDACRDAEKHADLRLCDQFRKRSGWIAPSVPPAAVFFRGRRDKFGIIR